jgi:hypothetical protein
MFLICKIVFGRMKLGQKYSLHTLFAEPFGTTPLFLTAGNKHSKQKMQNL